MKQILEVPPESRVVFGRVAKQLPPLLPDRRIIAIVDAAVDTLYPSLCAPFERIVVEGGEPTKSLASLERVYSSLIELSADRECFLLGVGGGVVTDLTGFVASTYMRGVPFGFVSTTLLGAVDASVGGKNGVNVGGYKNMVGTFCQPRFVLCDVNMLRTLPEREFVAGLAEVVKSAIIADAELFEMLEKCDVKMLPTDTALLENIVFRAIKVKADIVERDEREQGDRRKLNLGHTLAHAIEKMSSKMNHGEAVAVGIALICDMATSCGKLSERDNSRIKTLLQKIGFSLESPVELRDLKSALEKDKKSEGDNIQIVFPCRVGECVVEKMPLEEFKAMF